MLVYGRVLSKKLVCAAKPLTMGIYVNNANELPLVSVAIITYNQVGFLRECIESVLAQDYSNIEIIVADDGSNDGTHEFLRQKKLNHPETKFVLRLSAENMGITSNSNAAHFSCSGKYIAWMGGDDLMLPGKLAKQVEFMECNDDVVVCFHDLDVFESSTNKTMYKMSQQNTPRTGLVSTMVKHGPFNGACSTMVRRDMVPSGFDRRVPIASDWLYWIEAMSSGGRIGYIDEVLGRYRRHGNNVTATRHNLARTENVEDHIITCAIVASRYPGLTREAMYRCAHLLIELRFSNGGAQYSRYLRASLRTCFNFKALAGLVLNFAFRIKR